MGVQAGAHTQAHTKWLWQPKASSSRAALFAKGELADVLYILLQLAQHFLWTCTEPASKFSIIYFTLPQSVLNDWSSLNSLLVWSPPENVSKSRRNEKSGNIFICQSTTWNVLTLITVIHQCLLQAAFCWSQCRLLWVQLPCWDSWKYSIWPVSPCTACRIQESRPVLICLCYT